MQLRSKLAHRGVFYSLSLLAPRSTFVPSLSYSMAIKCFTLFCVFLLLQDSFAMLAGGGEVMSSVEGLVSAGSKCCLLREEQEGAVTVAAALQVAQDVRDVVEVCAAQLVR